MYIRPSSIWPAPFPVPKALRIAGAMTIEWGRTLDFPTFGGTGFQIEGERESTRWP